VEKAPGLTGARRLWFVLAVATAAGLIVALKRVDHPEWLSDLAQLTVAAQGWWHGQNPYAAVRAWGQWPFPLLYPFPAVLAVFPLSFLRPSWLVDALFVALSTGLLTWGLTRDRHVSPKLVALISAPFLYGIILSQWSPLLVGAALVPGAGALLICKPSIGLALLVGYPRWSSVIGCGLFLFLSLLIQPVWPWDWLAAIREAPNAIAPITVPYGWLVVPVAICWRQPGARVLFALACIPHTTLAYEALALFLIVETWTEAWILWIGTAVALVGHIVAGPYASQYEWVRHGAIWLIWCVYLPCTMMIVRRRGSDPLRRRLPRAFLALRPSRWFPA
jgi:hypothetical protein